MGAHACLRVEREDNAIARHGIGGQAAAPRIAGADIGGPDLCEVGRNAACGVRFCAS
jgi:hypothetical protein